MTATRWVQVVCDGCGSRQKWAKATLAEARAAAKADHWHHINPVRDICPDCWKEKRR